MLRKILGRISCLHNKDAYCGVRNKSLGCFSYHQEHEYLSLIEKTLGNGELKTGRNGSTISHFGHQMRFSLKNGTIPLLTTKRVAWKTCLRELLWFIKGDTNNKHLQEKKVSIWNGNASRAFLDSRGLHGNAEGDLGPVYGHQWRFYNAKYTGTQANYTNEGVDQLQYVIDCLTGKHPTEDKYSRRLIVNAWNPCQLNEMALPPCHVLFQLYVNQQNELSCSLYQRSGDIGLGIPFNIASYSFLTHLIAHHVNLKPGEFIHTIGDCHIYDDHVDAMRKQLMRKPHEFPQLKICEKRADIGDYLEEDFDVLNYVFHKKIPMNMRV